MSAGTHHAACVTADGRVLVVGPLLGGPAAAHAALLPLAAPSPARMAQVSCGGRSLLAVEEGGEAVWAAGDVSALSGLAAGCAASSPATAKALVAGWTAEAVRLPAAAWLHAAGAPAGATARVLQAAVSVDHAVVLLGPADDE